MKKKKGMVMSAFLSAAVLVGVSPVTAFAAESGNAEGTALVKDVDGDFADYNIKATVTVKDGKITDIKAEPDDSSYTEDNDPYWDWATEGRTRRGATYDGVIKQILDKGSAEGIDTVSGATCTSEAIIEAVKAAVADINDQGSDSDTSGGSSDTSAGDTGSGNADDSNVTTGSTSGSSDKDNNKSDGVYVLMNIPYSVFFNAEGADIADVDTVSSATNKTGNYGKSGGAFHSGKTAGTDGEGNVTAVGSENGSKVKGVTWPVKASDIDAVKELGGTHITDDASVTTATAGRGNISSNLLRGYQALTEAPAYAYYVLSEAPENFLELKDGKIVAGKNGAKTESKIDAEVRYGTNWGDVQLDLGAAEDASDKIVNAMVITTDDGTVKGLYHLDQIWAYNEIGWKADVTSGLDGKTITNIRYYCSVKDEDTTDTAVPAYTNFIYDYPVEIPVASVYTGDVTAEFEDNSKLIVEGIPDDAVNVKAKVYHTTGGRGAVLTYLTPLAVDPSDDDIDPETVEVRDGEIVITPGSVTNNAGTTAEFGNPVDGNTYVIELSSDNYIFRKAYAEYVEGKGGWVLMNIPYSDFYENEIGSEVDAVSSATLNKPRTGTLAGGSYHKNADGSDISGIIYPVRVNDLESLDGKTQITDDSKVSITVTNRGQESTTDYEGKDALFESDDYSYYILDEKPEYYKKLTVGEDGTFSFGKVRGNTETVEGVTAETDMSGRHTDIEIKLSGTEGIEQSDKISGVIITDEDGVQYGLRHVYNIWRGTELGWDRDEDGLNALIGKTVKNIRYITDSSIIDYPVNIIIKDYEIKAEAKDGNTVTVSDLPEGIKDEKATVSFTVGEGREAVTTNVAENAEIVNGEVAVDPELEDGRTYNVKINNSVYPVLKTSFVYYADKAPVENAISEAEVLEKDKYTDGSWAKLSEAVDAAKEAKATEFVTRSALDAAEDKVKAAIQGLELAASESGNSGSETGSDTRSENGSETAATGNKTESYEYKITEGEGSTYTKGSKENLKFATNGTFEKYKGIIIDGKEYEIEMAAEEGDFGFELYADFLETLEDGTHEITISFEDGEAKGHFIVKDVENKAKEAAINNENTASTVSRQTSNTANNSTPVVSRNTSAGSTPGVVSTAGTAVKQSAPSTGDKNNTVIYAGIAAASGAAAIAAGIVIRRKKSER